jgi:endo-1,3(4)-beta-glucanase
MVSLLLLMLLQGFVCWAQQGDVVRPHSHSHRGHHGHQGHLSPERRDTPPAQPHPRPDSTWRLADAKASAESITLADRIEASVAPEITSLRTATETATTSPPSNTADNLLTSTASVITISVSSGTAQVLASTWTPGSGTIVSTLETEGHPSQQPLLTAPIPTPTTTISTPSEVLTPPSQASPTMPLASDIFEHAISTDSIPSNIGRRKDHPQPRLGIESTGPIQTNKFYANFFLGSQRQPAYLFPYSVAWAGGNGPSASWGLSISHIDSSQRVYGHEDPVTNASRYYANPVGVQSIVLSAKELGPGTALTTDQLTDLSVRVSLRPTPHSSPAVQFPLVQGAAFITAVYNGSTPLIQTGVYFRTVTRATQEIKPGVTRYKLRLEDGATWLLYAHHAAGTPPLDMHVLNNGLAQARGPFHGVVQVAKDPGGGGGEDVYDAACGAYPVGVHLSGAVHAGGAGSYTFRFRKAGMEAATLLMYALPHHQSSFDAATRGRMTGLRLDTPTKGVAQAVAADAWTMVEAEMPWGVEFVPWKPGTGSVSVLGEATRKFVHNVTLQELSQNMVKQSDQDSMYFSGKVSSPLSLCWWVRRGWMLTGRRRWPSLRRSCWRRMI